jgi:hypothetical protein
LPAWSWIDNALHCVLCTTTTSILRELWVDTFQPPCLWTACGKPKVLLSNPIMLSVCRPKHFWLLMKQLANSQIGWGAHDLATLVLAHSVPSYPIAGKFLWRDGNFVNSI